MVLDRSANLDRVFHALAHPARRAILRQLTVDRERNLSELSAPLRMSFPAASKHVRVLERAKLVRRRVAGRTHLCRLQAQPLKEIAEWTEGYRKHWEIAFEALDELLAEMKQTHKAQAPTPSRAGGKAWAGQIIARVGINWRLACPKQRHPNFTASAPSLPAWRSFSFRTWGPTRFCMPPGYFRPMFEPMSDAMYGLAFAYRAVFSLIGCYITALLAPCSPVKHALILGFIGVILSAAGAAATWNAVPQLGPRWYSVSLIVSALPCAWIGGALREMQLKRLTSHPV